MRPATPAFAFPPELRLRRYDRVTAARFNIAPQLIDHTLYDVFGQRLVQRLERILLIGPHPAVDPSVILFREKPLLVRG